MRVLVLLLIIILISACNTYRITNKDLSKLKLHEYQNILGTLDIEIDLKKASIRKNNIKMSGYVREMKTKENLEGVTVYLKNGLERRVKLTESSLNGYFSFKCNVLKNDTLSFSFIGYKSLNFQLEDKH